MSTFMTFSLGILVGAFLGAIGIFLTMKEADIIQGYEIRISSLEAENARLRAIQEVNIDDNEYHPENMERLTAKEIKYGGF